jgi:hypothetical protein
MTQKKTPDERLDEQYRDYNIEGETSLPELTIDDVAKFLRGIDRKLGNMQNEIVMMRCHIFAMEEVMVDRLYKENVARKKVTSAKASVP